MNKKICCFIGHRRIVNTLDLKEKIYFIIEKLIVEKKIENFLFGSKSEFNSVCLEIVTLLKEKYPYIKHIYVRVEYPYISEEYKMYFLKSYDETYYPEK